MAHQHSTRAGEDAVHHRPPVYHVVQQVVHAQPVAQHRPVFYGKENF